MEPILQFAGQHRLRTRKDECGDLIITGRRGTMHHIFDNGDGRLGICLMFDGHPAKWTYAKQKAAAAGLTVRQDGYGEGTMLFDPSVPKQSRMALKLTGARIKRVLTADQRETLAERLRAARAVLNY
jgi:hypothetical protein